MVAVSLSTTPLEFLECPMVEDPFYYYYYYYYNYYYCC